MNYTEKVGKILNILVILTVFNYTYEMDPLKQNLYLTFLTI